MPVISQNKEECPYQITWQGCFGTQYWENESAFCKTIDSGYIIATSVIPINSINPDGLGGEDIQLIKLNKNRETEWSKYYGGSSADICGSIVSDGKGYYYISGNTWSSDSNVQSYNHGFGDNWIFKIDSSGDIVWEHCFGGSGEDYGGGLRLLSDGNLISFSASSSSDGDVGVNYGFLDVWLFIFTPEGEILQNKVLGNHIHNSILDLIETNDGGFFFTSQGCPGGMIPPTGYHGDDDVWCVKLDRQFNIEWQKLYGGAYNEYGLYGIKELDNGYVFLARTNSNDGDVSGLTGTPGSNSTMNIWVVRIDSNGNLIWQQCFGSGKLDYTRDIFPTEDKGFIIFGDRGMTLDCFPSGAYSDVWVIKTDSIGNLEWQVTYGAFSNDHCWGAIKKDEFSWMILSTIWAMVDTCDVKCTHIGSSDVWMFEIKDCDQYQPSTPTRPEGPDTLLCSVLTPLSIYTTRAVASADGYDWQLLPDVAGMTASTDTSMVVTWNPAYEGNATLKVRSLNTCGTSQWSDSLVLQVRTCIGINETNEIGFLVWPNPANDKVVFSYTIPETKEGAQLTITDALGRQIITFDLNGSRGEKILHTHNLRPGVYFYTLSTVNVSKVGKLVISY
ncbi:MAG: hypothetical protein A2X11_13005 [Bacteroidetes bacterium GWE2_42_24]|nr:MAG: hypothetical protein A2X11_13005 [Bacteroidetes bacterium GWE2_42_24]OFY25326.1 MAG: hypothetical protein A2X09_10205 [Bacteroidetes bacterium GWF2_43_11]